MQTYRISQAASLLGVSKWTLRDWTRRKMIPHMRLPSGRWRWTWKQIEDIRAAMNVDAEEGEPDAEIATASCHGMDR